ncbi:MAG TPA: NUDIX domain-containing protein [Verrucomicrobiae bacterium]|nr:NUDIX domain-containing protein [Verrucomicrobiae bacterium]
MDDTLDKINRFTVIPTAYLLLRRDDKVLLLRRANTGYMDGYYSLVAGHLETSEPATAGMVREAKEEADITISPTDLKLIHIGHRYNRSRLDLFFETNLWKGTITNVEPDKCDDLSWHSLNQLPDTTIPYVRLVLDAISNGFMYTEYFEEV